MTGGIGESRLQKTNSRPIRLTPLTCQPSREGIAGQCDIGTGPTSSAPGEEVGGCLPHRTGVRAQGKAIDRCVTIDRQAKFDGAAATAGSR